MVHRQRALGCKGIFLAIERVEGVARQQGALLALRHALLNSGMRETWEGKFSDAAARFAEFLDIRGTAIDALSGRLNLDAWRGDEIGCPGQDWRTLGAWHCHWGWLGASKRSSRLSHAGARIWATIAKRLPQQRHCTLPEAPSWSCWALPLLVEASVRCGDKTAAKTSVSRRGEK